MAKACRGYFQTDFGIGITGTMGNIDPANEESSIPGQVYFAIDKADGVESFFVELPPLQSRLQYKLAVAEEVFERLITCI